MENKILEITKKEPQKAELPDGIYEGIWGGYIITINYNGETYEAKTEHGVRGIGFKVIVIIKDGNMTFHQIKN